LHGKAPFRALRLHGRDPAQPREFDLLINGEPMRDAYGRAAGWHGTMTDVTRAVAQQATLQQRETEREGMLDNDLIGVLKIREGRIVWKNRAMDRIFGFGPDDLHGETTRLLHLDEASYQATLGAADRAIRARGHYRDQVWMNRKDGGHLRIDLHAAPLSAQTQGALWLLVDITALRPELG
jgi:PAS domain S-box-containing protein